MLLQQDQDKIRTKTPPGTKVVAVTTLMMPDELLRIVAEALEYKTPGNSGASGFQGIGDHGPS
jgi:hypothetical protein